jgi:DNA-directed RNA polymerase subunit M/transcription elongation factor TFIIS
MYSYETTTTAASNKPSHIYESSNAHQKIERNQIHSFSSQPSHYCSDNNIADSLTAVNYFIPSSQTGHPNSDFVHLEEDTQFGFGGCSQEEISNLVDQVLSSIDAFPTTTDVQVECDNRQTSGTLCQDCGNFVEIETSPNDLTHLFCQHCGASIDFDRQSVDENSSQAVNVNDESSNTIMW